MSLMLRMTDSKKTHYLYEQVIVERDLIHHIIFFPVSHYLLSFITTLTHHKSRLKSRQIVITQYLITVAIINNQSALHI